MARQSWQLPDDDFDWADPDHRLARELLFGDIPDGGYLHGYLEDERDARKALVRVLLDDKPLPRSLRQMLAHLFDPDATADPNFGCPRILKFKNRSKERQPQFMRDFLIARSIRQRGADMSVADAVADAAEQFGLSPERVWKVWERWKPELDRILGLSSS